MSTSELDKLRSQIQQVDEDILNLVAKRQSLAKNVATYKEKNNLPIKAYGVEKNIYTRTEQLAQSLDINADLVRELTKLLITHSVMLQDNQIRKQRQIKSTNPRKVLIVGGNGNMGRWFAEFFRSFGDQVELFELEPSSSGSDEYKILGPKDWDDAASQSQIIVLATPITATDEYLTKLSASNCKALIFDICSLKSPIKNSFALAESKGLKVTSIHPMFGPSATHLAGLRILMCKGKNQEASAQAKEIFATTTATLIEIPFNEHDKVIGYLLGMSHLSNLIFAKVLEKSSFKFSELTHIGSTTFNSQTQVTKEVIEENKNLYYEIQSLNDHKNEILKIFSDATAEYSQAISDEDQKHFVDLMGSSQEYFHGN